MFTNEAAVEEGVFVAFLERVVTMDTSEAFDMVDIGLTAHDHFISGYLLTAVGAGTRGSKHSAKGEREIERKALRIAGFTDNLKRNYGLTDTMKIVF